MFYSFQKSKQPGPITRLLSCSEEQLKQFKDVDGIPTHVSPSWSIHPITGDNYRSSHHRLLLDFNGRLPRRLISAEGARDNLCQPKDSGISASQSLGSKPVALPVLSTS